MPAQTNKRIYFATQQAGLKADGFTGAFTVIHGLQSIGMTTNFNLSQIQVIGQLQVFDNVEDIPDIEVSLNKVLDGYPLIYHLATRNAANPTLAGRSNESAVFAISIFSDTNESATGTPVSQVECSGMFVSSVGYTFNLDGPFTEDITLVGNNKIWANDNAILGSQGTALDFTGGFTNNNDTPSGSGGVNHKEDLIFDFTSGANQLLDTNGMVAQSDTTILPPEVFGISASGTNQKSNGEDYDAHVQSISVSATFGRTSADELGRRGPFHRFMEFPVEISTEVETITGSGDMISATEAGIRTTTTGICVDAGNLANRTIRIATCDGTRIYTGVKNKLSSVNYSGGDTGGGQVSTSYTFTTFSDLTVMQEADVNTNFTYANRNAHLLDL